MRVFIISGAFSFFAVQGERRPLKPRVSNGRLGGPLSKKCTITPVETRWKRGVTGLLTGSKDNGRKSRERAGEEKRNREFSIHLSNLPFLDPSLAVRIFRIVQIYQEITIIIYIIRVNLEKQKQISCFHETL